MKKEIIITKDGAHSLYIPKINETYHSVHGAISEAMHVFIKNGLNHHGQKNINILEIGFGTGLNSLLTIQQNNKEYIHYTTLEPFPISEEIYSKLNFYNLINYNKDSFIYLHTSDWKVDIKISKNFTLYKLKSTLQEFNSKKKFDIIYFDAFAPEKQPEMWTKKVFEKCYKILDTEGFLVTYCAKGVVKRTLKSVGFEIENLKGPPGKREMIRANKTTFQK